MRQRHSGLIGADRSQLYHPGIPGAWAAAGPGREGGRRGKVRCRLSCAAEGVRVKAPHSLIGVASGIRWWTISHSDDADREPTRAPLSRGLATELDPGAPTH